MPIPLNASILISLLKVCFVWSPIAWYLVHWVLENIFWNLEMKQDT